MKMYKFDGSNPAIWLAQMEQYFTLEHIVDDETKLSVAAIYLDQEIWQWWQCHQKCYPRTITWQMFTKIHS